MAAKQRIKLHSVTEFMCMQVNTFQAVLATDGNQTYVMFLYQDIQWSSATSIGLNAGDGSNFVTVPESLTVEGVLNLTNTSNVGLPGVYIYRVDQVPPTRTYVL